MLNFATPAWAVSARGDSVPNFAIIGVAGFVAPRHLKAIHDTGNDLIAAADPRDSVGILDRYFPKARFFTEIERFDRMLEKQRRAGEEQRVHYVSICSPNYLHDAHVRLALRVQANAICEKPLVINPWNLDILGEMEAETGCRVYTVLQLRHHPALIELKRQLDGQRDRRRAEITLTYVTRRGHWYDVSWKSSQEKSGGVAMNIGVHFFDLLGWLFGRVQRSEVHLREPRRMAGRLELDWARVRWFLSVDETDLPEGHRRDGKPAFRSLTMDGQEIEFSEGFSDLHTRIYEAILAGQGVGIEQARFSIDLVHAIRHAELASTDRDAHPVLTS